MDWQGSQENAAAGPSGALAAAGGSATPPASTPVTSTSFELSIVHHQSFTNCLFFVSLAGRPMRLVKQHRQWLETAHIRVQYNFLLITVLNRHLRYRALPALTISVLECCTRSVLG